MDGTIYILTFHGLGIPERGLLQGEDLYWLAPSFFQAILDRVKHRPDVFVTFDDSNSSDFAIALPELLRRGMRASFFVVSERIDLPGYLSVDQVRELARAGMVIGSHGTRHRPWAQLSGRELDEELNASRRRLAEVLGQAVDQAACPFGSYNRRVLQQLRAAGYTKVYTSDQGPARAEAWFLPRNTIRRGSSLKDVDKVIDGKPRCLSLLWRKLKLMVKQWR
jgi:peptidoglycan/xylan/chitin deacetylase (PgdA/CDA1 family)